MTFLLKYSVHFVVLAVYLQASPVQGYYECNEELVSSSKLRASSQLNLERGPDKAVRDSGSSWTAGVSDFGQFIEVDMKEMKRVHYVETLGKQYTSEFVQEFRIYFGNNGGDYQEYKDRDGNTKLFDANRDGDSPVINYFDIPIIARYIRLNPTRWRDRISMRVELVGCKYEAEALNFDGQAYVMKALRRAISSLEDRFSFRFRTNHPNGLLLYSRGTQKDIFALQLVENQLTLNVDLGGEGQITTLKVGSLLDDNLWHDVSIHRNQSDITFSVDRVLIQQVIKGDSIKLDLNREFFIGGLPYFSQEGVVVTKNFTGCIENLYFNQTDVIREIKEDNRRWDYQIFGETLYSCQFEQVIPVTFASDASYIRVNGYMQRQMNTSFDFRTFNENGMLLYNKFSGEGHVLVYLEKGLIKVELQGKNTPVVILSPFDENLADGRWHKTMLVLQNNRIELHIDRVPSITSRRFSMETGQHYLIGGGVYGRRGFLGCMRFLYIEGRYINPLVLSPDQHFDAVVFDACTMLDRCNPNPCEHKGVCRQTWTEFLCDCTKTGYSGAVCHVSRHPLSCEGYRIEHPLEVEKTIQIDVDGSGPLAPFEVHCLFHSDNRTETVVHHKAEHAVEVEGYQAHGSFVQDIVYAAPLEQIVELVNRSTFCRQTLRYDCFNSKLFDSPTDELGNFHPYGWWVSRTNQAMNYWGGSISGSHKCACGLTEICDDPGKWCNCDSGKNKWLSDHGDLTDRNYLPVRQLRYGDTGNMGDNRKGLSSLSALHCEGDDLFDNVITFRYSDATIEIPRFNWAHSGDIYFQFRTTAENGILVHSKGYQDFIKVVLVGGDQIQFQYQAGNGLLGVSVETSYKLNNDQWHSVHVERNRKEARIVIDGSQSAEVKERLDRARPFNLTASRLVIGASVDYKEGFVGCLRAFLINGQLVDLKSQAHQGLYGVSVGCVGKCISSPCQNNGICLEGYSHYSCDCQWTPFKGPICADEIGVNLRSDSYVRYDFETTVSTLEEFIRVGFTTTEHQGMIFGMSSKSGEYLNLMMSTSGHLRLVFDFGFERQELTVKNENFALGQIHDVQIVRSDKGRRLSIYVDNYPPHIHTFNVGHKADAQFNELKSIYVGRNETMSTGEGFSGCITRVQFEDHVPLRRLFQESRRANVHAFPDDLREDTCGIEAVTYPEEQSETRPPPTLPLGVFRESFFRPALNESAILGIIFAILLAAFILMCFILSRFISRHKGDYITQEDHGALDAPDADTAVMHAKTGHHVMKKKEWFL
ncbi:neurexin-4-like [Varroa jacobsoni]|uniref:neurexin-4-like n=1 Tax=Varroa jacobsoni TaxID=62625 RepID=UPI000BF97016|nr:neurexin-4-like [Varroa jacobsoni]